MLEFYNGLSGNDSWSSTWDLYEGQTSSSRSEVLLKLPNSPLEFESCPDSDSDECLTFMNLTKIGLVGDIPDGLSSLTELSTIILKNNEIEGFEDDLFEKNEKLKVIDLSFNNIRDYSGNFPSSLTSLDMSNNSLKMNISAVLKTLSDAESIEMLNLAGNKINGSIESDTDVLKRVSLKWMSIADNQIEGDLSATFDTIKDWSNLDISYNMFSGDFPDAFKNSEKINRQCNRFNCERYVRGPFVGCRFSL